VECILFSTYLGGSDNDEMRDVVAAADGSAWIAGTTLSTDWPTAAAMDATLGGFSDGVLVHVSSFGQLLMSSYVGSIDCERGFALSVASDGSVYMAGTVGLQTIFRCSFRVGWLVKLAAGGTSIAWSLYLLETESISDVATFIGAAEWGLPRPDVANVFGVQFIDCGFRLTVFGLAPGTYRLVVYAHSVNAPAGSFPYFETWTGIIAVQ
jgi:hypothetical protein